MKLFKRLTTLALALALVAGTFAHAVPASAAVEDSVAATDYERLNVNYNGSEDCEVEVTQGTKYIVVIPKKIVLDGSDGTGSYTVTVDADLAGTEYISVVPTAQEGGYVLHEQGGKADINYTVSQEKQVFIANGSVSSGLAGEIELQAAVEGYEILTREAVIVGADIATINLSAGTWTGTFDFEIAKLSK